MASTLHPPRLIGLSFAVGSFTFAACSAGIYLRHETLLLLVFAGVGLALSVVCLIGLAGRLCLDEAAIGQWMPLSGRQRWRFDARHVAAWSEIEMETAHWLAMKPGDREMIDWKEPALIEIKRSYLLFKERDCGEIVQIDPAFTWTRNNREVLRQWFTAHVGPPLTGRDALHWHIDRKRDRRCFIKPPHRRQAPAEPSI